MKNFTKKNLEIALWATVIAPPMGFFLLGRLKKIGIPGAALLTTGWVICLCLFFYSKDMNFLGTYLKLNFFLAAPFVLLATKKAIALVIVFLIETGSFILLSTLPLQNLLGKNTQDFCSKNLPGQCVSGTSSTVLNAILLILLFKGIVAAVKFKNKKI